MGSPAWRRALLLLGATVLPVAAAPEPLAGAALLQELRNFNNTGTLLHVGAHPDDENTQLITWAVRGRGWRAAYLSVTRGDGGQNELGPDFDEKLGVLRTQELLAARRHDGGRQFFTRAIDFGYSKSPEETLRFWDRREVLGDVVRVIRIFRPDVIVTRFPIPPGSGGHGHHTASAILAVEAFRLAGDPAAYPEQLRQGLTPWQPKRVVWNSWGGRGTGGLDGPVISVDIGGADPVTGEGFAAIANESRGMHKTQGLGGFSGRGGGTGPNVQNFMLLAGEPAASDLADGVDTTWARYPGGAEIARLTDAAIAAFSPDKPEANVPAILAIRKKLAALPDDPLVADKRAQLDRILVSCLGLTVESTVDRPDVVPGEMPKVTTRVHLDHDAGMTISHSCQGEKLSTLAAGGSDLRSILMRIPHDTPLTQPYWLREEGAAGLARVSDPALIGRPEAPPAVTARHTFQLGDETLTIEDAVIFRPADGKATPGREVEIISPVSLAFDAEVFLVAPGASKQISVEVTAARPNLEGPLRLEVPAGWRVTPAAQGFRLAQAGDKASLTFTLSASAEAGAGRISATAQIGGREWSNRHIELRYAHLPVQLLQPPATARLVSIEAKTESRLVGYLPGAGDSIAEAIRQLGYSVRTLTGADLTPERLAGLRTVVIGVRAFNERDDLKDALPGLFAWVEQGGTVIAQYNRPSNNLPPLGPYPLSIAGPAPANRVTDETAPVTFLAPDDPVLNTPNKITAADFAGWVQERSTYQPSKWDEERYKSILAISDPGEQQPDSSLLVAKHGQGYYVYSGLAFFRQLPAGVPGAYRLFANLLSLGE